ncbi:LacI family DNA-binding transcriptional regulator [Bacillus sp. J37]|uniref:LacI family DNA-binding transcriptional regulator n=1 Tax=Bacillus sp. J37 TaxID=935837 RepID=UPI00047990DF|nr:LacI family DNA-binding transcriptional regulator [Bacillus sp. J37]
MTTIDDVAKKAGVSKSSVSRVLNQNYKHMSEEMKQKILKAIEELDFRPNSVAQSLKKKETKIIGLIIADMSPFCTEIIKGIQEECLKTGYSLMVSNSSSSPEQEEENIKMLIGKQVDGLIINTINPGSELFTYLKSIKFPMVFINSSPQNIEEDMVIVDNTTGTTEAIDYLINLGHKQIAIMLYPIENILVRQEKLEAYKQALTNHHFPVDHHLINIMKEEKGQGVQTTLRLLESPNPPTAILSTNINLTLEVLKAIREKGLKIPKDISVIGFDDFEWNDLLDPPLTTISTPVLEMGERSSKLLIKKLRKKQTKPAKSEVLPKLIFRQSTCKPRLKEITNLGH